MEKLPIHSYLQIPDIHWRNIGHLKTLFCIYCNFYLLTCIFTLFGFCLTLGTPTFACYFTCKGSSAFLQRLKTTLEIRCSDSSRHLLQLLQIIWTGMNKRLLNYIVSFYIGLKLTLPHFIDKFHSHGQRYLRKKISKSSPFLHLPPLTVYYESSFSTKITVSYNGLSRRNYW